MARYSITTAAAGLTFDTTLANHNSLVQVDATHFINFWSGAGSDGFTQVFTISTSTWAVTTAAASLEFDTVLGQWHSAVKIDANHFINFFSGNGSDGFAQVFTVNLSTWAVTTAAASLEFDTVLGQYHSAVRIDTTHYINFYAGNGSDGFAEVYTVNDTTWAVTTASTRLEFDTQQALWNAASAIDENHFINLWQDVNGDLEAQVFTVNTTTWAVTTAAAKLAVDTENQGWNAIHQIDSNHFIGFWSGNSASHHAVAQVLTVNTTTWAVSTAAARLVYDNSINDVGGDGRASVAKVDTNHFIQSWRTTGGDGLIQVFTVNTSTWAVTTTTSSLEFDTQNHAFSNVVVIDSAHYLLAWNGVDGTDGVAQVIEVEMAPNTPTLNSPADASSGSDTTPTLEFTGTDPNINISLPDGDELRYNIQLGTDSDFSVVNVYYFDCSDAGPSDSTAVWTDDANAFDGSTSTFARTTANSITAYLNGQGTNAPASNVDSISQVRARFHGTYNGSGVAEGFSAQIYTDGEAQLLGSPTISSLSSSPAWSSYVTLTTPTGGWSWAKLAALEVKIRGTVDGTVTNLDAYKVEVEVTSNGVLLDKLSGTDSGFLNTVTGGDTDPFNAGEKVSFTVQAGDALADGTYYWRVRALDPSGANEYGEWSATRSFTITSATTTTKTITGIARVEKSVTQTLLGKARITATTLQTILGRARITQTASQSIQGLARVTATTTKTLLGKASVLRTTSQAILGKGAVLVTATQTILGKARITISTSQTIQGLSRITASASQTILGRARITTTTLQTILGKASVLKTATQTLDGLARITKTVAQTLDGKARITATTLQTILGTARITKTVSQTIQGLAAIVNTGTQTILGRARITASATQTILGRARVTVTVAQTIQGLSRITVSTTQTLLGRARITASTVQTILGKGAILKTVSQTISGKASVLRTVTKTLDGIARITKTVSQTIQGLARVTASASQTILGKARVTATTTQTLLGKGSVLKTVTQTIAGLARITVSTAQTITGKARITASASQAILGLARITATASQTIQGLSRVTASATQTILGKARVTISTSQTIQGLSRITASTTQTILGLARITAASSQTIQGLGRITTTTVQTITGIAKIAAAGADTTAQTILGKARVSITSAQTIAGKASISSNILPPSPKLIFTSGAWYLRLSEKLYKKL